MASRGLAARRRDIGGCARGCTGVRSATSTYGTAGRLVHYAFGSSMGALYGGLVSAGNIRPFGTGVGFGAGLWAIADETLVPLAGLSEPSTRYPLKTHLYALSSHLVYGLSLDLARTLALQLSSRGVNVDQLRSGIRDITERVSDRVRSVSAA